MTRKLVRFADVTFSLMTIPGSSILGLLVLLAVAIPCITATADDAGADAPAAQAPAVDENGVAPELQPLSFMVGEWRVEAKLEHGDVSTVSTIRPILDGKVLEERASIQWDGETEFDMVIWRTYDLFRGTFRLAAVDNVYGFLDLFEGKFEDGELTQVHLGTHYLDEKGQRALGRMRMTDISEDRFKIVAQMSKDDGKTWGSESSVFIYTRKP